VLRRPRGQERQAHSWLRQALGRAAHDEYVRLFLDEGAPLLRLLHSLLGGLPPGTALRSYAQRLLRAAAQDARRPQIGSADPLLAPLTAQEQRVLRLLAAGWSNQEIARELMVSINTVKYHTKHLYRKLGVSNRQQAGAAARALSLDAGPSPDA
jgi:LuxR family maltose regulon positive regulatory protein